MNLFFQLIIIRFLYYEVLSNTTEPMTISSIATRRRTRRVTATRLHRLHRMYTGTGEPSEEDEIEGTGVTNLPGGMFQFKGEEAKRAFVKVSIRDAECYSSRSESSFVVFLAAMSYDDHHLSDVHIRSEKFVYDNLTNTHVFSGYLTIPSSYRNLNECFDDGNFDCVPRADVVYIRFESEPNDPWAIDQIDVDVTFRVTSNEESRHTWHFEHAILLPCSSWLKDRRLYQIGPRVGLFIEHPYRYFPGLGKVVRSWV